MDFIPLFGMPKWHGLGVDRIEGIGIDKKALFK